VLLEKLTRDGCRKRYGGSRASAQGRGALAARRVWDRMNKELRIIDQMGFTAYFLVAWDMIRYAQSRGFYHVGRGSGANSVVAYCLQITDVDPIELDLYFERFLNPHRTSPPDFDIDFSYRDRDEIIDYMLKRHGRSHTTLLGMYPTFQYNAIVRELGKVFGLPKEEIDGLAEKGYYTVAGRNQNFAKRPDLDNIHRAILQYGKLLQNFPSGLSIHPGGILISEEPLASWCTLHMPPKGFPTAIMDMFVAEAIGLYKLDVLSQRGLGHIRECVDLIKCNRGSISISMISAASKKIPPSANSSAQAIPSGVSTSNPPPASHPNMGYKKSRSGITRVKQRSASGLSNRYPRILSMTKHKGYDLVRPMFVSGKRKGPVQRIDRQSG
jgi:DNA polymerase-3 subunit alpha